MTRDERNLSRICRTNVGFNLDFFSFENQKSSLKRSDDMRG